MTDRAALAGELRRANLLTSALLHAQLLADERHRDPLRLLRFGAKCYSQADEDGILAEIFRRVGTTTRRFVEVGVHPLECNTLLLLAGGWRGLWIDARDHDLSPVAHHLVDGRLHFVRGRATRENVNELLAPAAGEVDLLVLDVDGNDYWLWEALTAVEPRVVVVEYNALFPPPLRVAVPYDPDWSWPGTGYFGASLEALVRLGARKGYALVGCSATGVNAFFVRRESAGGLFCQPFTAENHYEPRRYFLAFGPGHPPGYGPLVEID